MYPTETMICFLCQNPLLKAINNNGYIVQVNNDGNLFWSSDYELNIHDEWEIF